VATVSGSAPDVILDAIVAVSAVGGVPSFLALNLNDWATLLKIRDDGGSYLSSPFNRAGRDGGVGPHDDGSGCRPAGAGDRRGQWRADSAVREGPSIRASDAEGDAGTRPSNPLFAELRAALFPSFACVIDLVTSDPSGISGVSGRPPL
jgi:hypothetical protein